MDEIHIGNEIKKVLDKSDVSVSEFAKRINKSRGNVYSILSRKSIDTDLLQSISQVLNFDFFLLFSQTFDALSHRLKKLEKENLMVSTLNDLLLEKYGDKKK
ncbi:MAG: helix-turn-helix domain-containing protein [Flavobacteriales bacterium]